MADNAELATILQDYVPRSDYEAALDAIQEATKERDTHRTAAEKHTERLAQLEKAHRSRTWRDGYKKVARDLKIDPDYEDDVYDLLKLEPDADEPDEKALRKSVEAFLGDRGKKYVKADEKPGKKEIPAGEGATRGKSVAPGEPTLRVTKAQRNDAIWMRDNQKRMVEARRAGLLEYDED